LSNPQRFTLQPFTADPARNQPAINGQLHTQNDKFIIEFNTMQTHDNIKWLDFTQTSLKNDQQRQDNLWKQTCFELFVSSYGTSKYREFNFSPSGKWNSYDFTGYRQNPKNAEMESPHIKSITTLPDTHLLSVTLPFANLMQDFNSHSNQEIQFGVTAVVQYTDQSYDYYAHRHCGQEPDFHLRDSFDIHMSYENDGP